MTGWRVGYAVGKTDYCCHEQANRTNNLKPNCCITICYHWSPNWPQDSVEIMRQAFEERLNTICIPLLCQVPGFEVARSQGAFYLPKMLKRMEMKGYTNVTDFTTAILEEVGLALITQGSRSSRKCPSQLCNRLGYIKEAIRRLHQFMENKT